MTLDDVVSAVETLTAVAQTCAYLVSFLIGVELWRLVDRYGWGV